MRFIDSHAHLDMLPHLDQALAAAKEAGVEQIVTIGVDLESSRAAAKLAAAHPQVFASLGLHPHDAEKADEGYWREMEALARRSRPVAIGECGLDFYRDLSPRPAQRAAFARQIALALELGLPLVVHDRDAHRETAAMLAEHDAGRVGGVLHCFSGDLELARKVLDLGFSLGVTGVITYKNARALRELVRLVPAERLLIETDCPYLAPEPWRGKPNQPAYVARTCAGLAQALERPVEEVAALTTANARRVFALPRPGEA
ncbi:MAG: TatD family hydrolase [Desulfarculus sp.]|nr:TatD family hydrolase [Desulfarculus sp.]